MRNTSRKPSTRRLLDIIRSQKNGRAVGVCSICSANPFVLEAALLQGQADDSVVCIESTSNQVNQFGGYAGMTPAQYVGFVRGVARKMKVPFHRVVIGGDHLGPHVWRKEPAVSAMAKARDLVTDCVLAGYTKIHLDASMHLGGDPGDGDTPPPDEVITARAAEMCEAAEKAHHRLPAGSPKPLYVIGTEVPVPGGEQKAEQGVPASRTVEVARTLDLSRRAFLARGLESAWDRVIAIVVQPGVEFSDGAVFDYDRKKARRLSTFIKRTPQLVFEAHSTDYQTQNSLQQMVEDQFAILKVGPWVTFAFREAVFGLAAVEKEWLAGKAGIALSNLPQVLEEVMLESPAHWKPYYHGDDTYLQYARKYSYSDRSRYYWPHPRLQTALSLLMANLAKHPAPLALLSQYLPAQYDAVRAGEIDDSPLSLIRHKIMQVTGIYARACGLSAR